MKKIELDSWDDLDAYLKAHFSDKEYLSRVFQKVVFDNIGESNEEMVNNLELVFETGTDRRKNSHLWNVEGFDFDHDANQTSIEPDQIIYARKFRVNGTSVEFDEPVDSQSSAWKPFDLGAELEEERDALTIYDLQTVDRKSLNEFWFKSTALESLIAVIYVE
ncbi:TPA: hypothetical protein ACPHTX_004484 [Vibrio antiquarius]|nr:hypothetical protein [Vibrio cholerae]